MSQHLRWSNEQLREHLVKRHGEQAAAVHPAMKSVERIGPSALKRALAVLPTVGAFGSASLRDAHVNQGHDTAVAADAPFKRGKSGKPPGTKQSEKSALKRAPQKEIEGTKELEIKREWGHMGPLKKNLTDGSVRVTQRARAIESMESARWEGVHVPGEHLEIRFHGVVLLSVNTLYGLSHFQRVKYRKAWHELVERAISCIVGHKGMRQAFDRYVIFAHRVSRRLADTDAKSGYLKYPIDGLRYAGVLVEDTEANFRDFLCTQSIGQPALILRIESVNEAHVPMAMLNPWAQAIFLEFAPPEKSQKSIKVSKEQKRALGPF